MGRGGERETIATAFFLLHTSYVLLFAEKSWFLLTPYCLLHTPCFIAGSAEGGESDVILERKES